MPAFSPYRRLAGGIILFACLTWAAGATAGTPPTWTVAPPAPAADEAAPATLLRIALPLDTDIDHGRLDIAPDGRPRWRLRIHAPGAEHLGLALREARWPQGSSLRVEPGGTELSLDDFDADGVLWIPPEDGTTLDLTLLMPAGIDTSTDTSTGTGAFRPGRIRLHYGVHPFHGALDDDEAEPSGPVLRSANIGRSGNCHTNVACTAGNAWRPQIRSVARIIVGGQFLCSAQLVNNTARDGDPLLLTADHCGIGDGAGRFPASSVVVLWNFQSSNCLLNLGVSDRDRQQGGTLVYRDSQSDVALLRLSQVPAAAYDVHYAGWDVSGSPPTSGVVIHHPSGDLKKISGYNTPASAERVSLVSDNGTQTVDAWQVTWSQGSTERGSSGAGLWNAQRRVTGVLSGGRSSCEARDQPDFFGRLSEAWNRGDALRRALDPVGNGTRTLDGTDARALPGLEPLPPGEDSGGALGRGLLLMLAVLALAARRRG